MKSDKFKLGCDFHGVIDSMPDFFSFLTDSFVKNGGEVHIITGGSWTEELKNELINYNIKWTHYFSVYDYLMESNEASIGKVEFPDGTIQNKFPNEIWDKVKGEYCKKNNITLHIDDTLIYNEGFTTPFTRLWSNSGKPKSTHKDFRHLD
jgi:hypothetical protein